MELPVALKRRPRLVLLRRHDQGQVRFFLGDEPNAINREPIVVDDVLPLAVVKVRPHSAIGKSTMSDDWITIHLEDLNCTRVRGCPGEQV
jgi:hypothetical protein